MSGNFTAMMTSVRQYHLTEAEGLVSVTNDLGETIATEPIGDGAKDRVLARCGLTIADII